MSKLNRYYKGLLIFVAALIVLIITGGIIFWNYIDAYEVSLPEHVISEIRNNIDYDFWESEMNRSVLLSMTEFERDRAESVFEYLRSSVTDVQYTIRQKTDESTDEQLVYLLRAGMRDIGAVTLVSSEKIGFGFNMWEIGSIEFLDTFSEELSRTVSITVSQNAHVEINDITVAEDYRISCDIEHAKCYKIDNIFGEIEVTVTEWNGDVQEPYFVGNNDYIYPVIKPFSQQFNIISAAGIDFYVNDEKVEITTDNIVNKKIVPTIIEKYFSDFNEPPEVPEYLIEYNFEVDGLYDTPVITGKISDDAGREVLQSELPDGTIIFERGISDDDMTSCIEAAEVFIRAFINFTGKANGDVDENFSILSRYMLSGSNLYKRMSSAYFTLEWSDTSIITFTAINVVNLRAYGDEYFSCDIHYELIENIRGIEREMTGNYSVLFRFINDRLLAVWMDSI